MGREIERDENADIRMSVPVDYLDQIFESEFAKGLKSSASPPYIVKTIEAAMKEGKDKPLAPTAEMRYRAILGSIAWCETRPDLDLDSGVFWPEGNPALMT